MTTTDTAAAGSAIDPVCGMTVQLGAGKPSNTYRCADQKYIVIGGNGNSIFKRLMEAVGKPDMAEDLGPQPAYGIIPSDMTD